MMIVFVYDTEFCQEEADDPINAVLYFHPSWVSDSQKLSLCGNVMGVTHFLNETFYNPKIISLQSGKFALILYGRFILAFGTDRNISNEILLYRANLLSSYIKLYHCNIDAIHNQIMKNGEYKKLSEKIYQLMESYLPIIPINGNIFNSVPRLDLPISASNIYLESKQMLQSFQQTKGVLGGMIVYHNKVVSSQFSENLTKILVSSDPYRLKSSTELITVPFHLPVGSHLLNIYIESSEYQNLSQCANQAQSVFTNLSTKDMFLPFHVRKKSINNVANMTRDKSIIFSHIPEESEDVTYENHTNVSRSNSKFNRPTHLPLKSKNLASKDILESGFNSMSFDESDSFPNFIGKTSVCSTPMTENRIFHHEVSICANNDIKKDIVNVKSNPKNQLSPEDFSENYTQKDTSINGIIVNIIKPVKNILSKSLTNLSNKTVERKVSRFTICKIEKNSDEEEKISYTNYRTISDPTFIMFNNRGSVISKCFYNEFIHNKYDAFSLKNDTKRKICNIKNDAGINKISNVKHITIEEKSVNIPKSTKNRKSLSLPIKSLNMDLNVPDDKNKSYIFDSPARRRKLAGLQLTPLMTKLTVLAMYEQHSSGFSSWDTSPGYSFNSTMTPTDYLPKRKNITIDDKVASKTVDDSSIKVELFICGQQNMVLILLLEDKSSEKQDLIQSLFDTCISKITKIETSLDQVMNVNVDAGGKGKGEYSFIYLDEKWGTTKRGGPWTPNNLASLESMQNQSQKKSSFTEMILKNDDVVFYGNQSGKSHIFYHQAALQQPGLPPPHDPIGTVQISAKRRLERDHSIILL